MDNFCYSSAFVVILSILGRLKVTCTATCSHSDYKELFGVLSETWKDFRGPLSELEQSQNPTNVSFFDYRSLDIRGKTWNDNFGRRFRAYFLAPETGDYKFYIACDDSCKLRISADDELRNLKTVINITKWTNYKKWKSSDEAKMRLFKGHSYLLEVIWKQHNGKYHLTVGVQLPKENKIRTVSDEWLIKYTPERYRYSSVGQRVLHIKFCSAAKVVVKWMQVPPLCYKDYNAGENKQPVGLFPEILPKMINYVCSSLDCGHKKTTHKKTLRGHERTSRLRSHKSAARGHRKNVRGNHRTTQEHVAKDHEKTRNSRRRNVRHHEETTYHRTARDQKMSSQNQTRPVLDFREKTVSIHNITNTLSVNTEFILPISMMPKGAFVGEEWVFLPLVEVEGHAILLRKPNPGEKYAGKLGSSVMDRWPVIVVMFVLYCVFGLAVWNVEKAINKDQFSPRFSRGWKQGLWWAFVTMTTVGYGDRYPVTVPGRFLAVVSLLVGVVMNALFIATVTASITVFVIEEAANPAAASRIGIVTGSIEHPFGMRMNGRKGIRCVSYPTRDALLKGLKSRSVEGALINVLTVDFFKKELNDSEFEIVKILPTQFYYGIILTGDARNLSNKFKEYLVMYPIEFVLQDKKERTGPKYKTKDAEQTVTVIPFFQPDNILFTRSLIIIGALLILSVISGLCFHFVWPRMISKKGEPRAPHNELTAVKEELTQLLEEFHSRIKATYFTLKIKHKRELLQFRHRRGASIITAKSCIRKGSLVPQQV